MVLLTSRCSSSMRSQHRFQYRHASALMVGLICSIMTLKVPFSKGVMAVMWRKVCTPSHCTTNSLITKRPLGETRVLKLLIFVRLRQKSSEAMPVWCALPCPRQKRKPISFFRRSQIHLRRKDHLTLTKKGCTHVAAEEHVAANLHRARASSFRYSATRP